MKRNFLLFFLLVTVTALAQPGPDTGKERFLKADTIQLKNVKLQDSLDAVLKTADSIQPVVIDEKNIITLVQTQEKLNKRKKQGAFIRIAIGIFFLVILVIGLRRKRKQPAVDNQQ